MTRGAPTPHESVVANGSFGGTLKAINGGMECPALSGSENSVVSRLDKYCAAATQLGTDVLLNFEACTGLETAFTNCTASAEANPALAESCANCLVWLGVTLSPTQAPSQKPTSAPSKSPSAKPTTETQAPTGSPSRIPTSSPTYILPAFYGYDLVGEGNCQANHAFLVQTYDYLLFESYSSLDECPGVCAPYRDVGEFRGLEFGSPSLSSGDEAQASCKCLFDNNADLAAIQTNYGGTPTVTNGDGQGSGPIVDVVSKSFVECYKAVPLEAPQDVVGFEYIGFGNCLDSSDQKYDFISVWESVTVNASDFAVACESSCSSIQSPRGFFVEEGTTCNCLFDDGTEIDGQTMNDPATGDGGSGEIITSDHTGGHCYKFVAPPTMGPTASPSKRPTDSPSSAPTKAPTSSPSTSPSKAPSTSPSKSVSEMISFQALLQFQVKIDGKQSDHM